MPAPSRAAPHRVTDVDDAALTGFLGSCPPFDSLGEQELSRLVAHAVVESYAPGAVVLDAFDHQAEELYVVWRGRVGIWTHPDRLSELPDKTEGVGGLFGYVAALTGAAVGPRAVAVGELVVVRFPADLVVPAFASRHGARFLAQQVSSTNRRTDGLPAYTLVDDLLDRAPLVVEQTATVADAAARMSAAGLGYAAVRTGPGRYGLVTDATVRDLVAAARPVTTPVTEVMSTDPPVVRLGESATEALIEVLECAADVVLVTDRAGELRGAVTPADFIVSSTTAGAALHEQLRRAADVEELQLRYRRVPELIGDLVARGLASGRVITVHSALVDTLVRRAIQLVFGARDDLGAEAFTWLSLGSNGRREAVLSSDLDAAAAFADDVPAAEIARYRPAFQEVTRVLAGAGIEHDGHGVSPANPEFSRTHREWADAARGWLARPGEGDAMIKTCLLVDGRPIHGDPALPEVARVFGDLRLHPSTAGSLLAISVDRSDRLRGRWRRRTVDLKRQALLPIANIARWAALTARSPVLRTPDRLRAAAGSPMLSVEDAETLADVFEIVQRMRLRMQLEQLAAGARPTDVVDLRTTSAIEVGVLTAAVREILAIQRRMATKARYVPPALPL